MSDTSTVHEIAASLPPATISAQYIKDFSFESPNAPQIFAPSATAPDMQMGVNILTRKLADNTYEVILAIKMETRLNGKTAFIAELAYAGIFMITDTSEQQLKIYMLVECPRLLYPFARSIMMTAIRDGGFPQVMMSPIDFAELYIANKDNLGAMTAVGAA